MLTRLLQKVQRFTTQHPTTAATLYNSFNEIFVSEIEKLDKLQSNNLKITPTIKNLLIIRRKGHLSNKRITSTIELASNKKKKTAKKISMHQDHKILLTWIITNLMIIRNH